MELCPGVFIVTTVDECWLINKESCLSTVMEDATVFLLSVDRFLLFKWHDLEC